MRDYFRIELVQSPSKRSEKSMDCPEIEYTISEMGDYFRIEVVQTTAKDLKKDLNDQW